MDLNTHASAPHTGGRHQTYPVDLTRLPYDSVSGAVVNVVAGYTGTPTEDLLPLTDGIDPDALDALLDGAARNDRPQATTVRFQYHGLSIRVSSTGVLRFKPVDDTRTGAIGRADPPDETMER